MECGPKHTTTYYTVYTPMFEQAWDWSSVLCWLYVVPRLLSWFFRLLFLRSFVRLFVTCCLPIAAWLLGFLLPFVAVLPPCFAFLLLLSALACLLFCLLVLSVFSSSLPYFASFLFSGALLDSLVSFVFLFSPFFPWPASLTHLRLDRMLPFSFALWGY